MKEVEENIETGLEIAIIGMACRFPGANNIGQFWTNLKDGVESISFLNEEELAEINPELRNNPNFVKTKGGILDNFDCFDAFFFNYTPSEAEFMAPSMRLFHECAWEALEDSGYVPGYYREPIGLYIGIQSTVNWENLSGSLSLDNELGAFTAAGLSNRDYMSTMIAYKLNLIGPSFSLNTACSTSLVAVHLACQGLLSGDCRMALAGGSALRFPRPLGSLYEEGMIVSPDGHTRTFDAAASGTTGSDGIGAVVLKQLEDAVSDGDYIYAVIKGSAINNDGNRKVGYTAPSIEGQAEVIRKTYQAAEINPEDIGYIEAHGTATPLGDVTEVEALKIAFNTNKKHFCRLGSVKTNLGHLDIAAGIAGFIKTVLVLKNKQIPPSLHFQKPNPAVDFENSPFYINTKLEAWENNEKPRRAGVSSFGIGGTNAHVVLEEYKNRFAPPYSTAETFQYLFLLSAKTQTALNNITINLAQFLRENPGTNLADVAYTLQVGRKHFPFRKKLVSNSLPDTIAKLSSLDSRKTPSYHLTSEEKEKKVIFMFPGLGPQYVNMGLGLYQSEPLFRAKMDHCFAILKSLGYDIKEILYPPANSSSVFSVSSVANFEIAQFVIFSIEYALAHLIMSWGIKPYAMIGYSFGEYTAACIAGVFKLEDILKLLVTRGKLISPLPPGMMLSVPLTVNGIKSILPSQLAIAIDNGSSCVISGPSAVIQTFEKELKTKKIICMPLDATQAIHSPMMEPILEKFTAALANITLTPPQIPYISTVTGNWIKIEDAVSPNYWAKQLRETVYFARGIENLNLDHDPNIIFLEVGPGRDISALVEREINEKGDRQKNPIIHLVRQPKKEIPDDYYLLDKIGLLWLHGVSIDWQTFYQGKKLHRIPLPTYPFDKHHFWKLPGKQKIETALKQDIKKERNLEDCFYIPSWKQTIFPSFTAQSDNVPVHKNHYFLIFLDQDNHKNQYRFAVNLIQHLKQQDYQVITAAKGEIFSHENDHYIIDPGRKEDYDSLIQDICSRGMEKFPLQIIYLWTLGNNETDQGGKTYFQKQQEIGYYSFLYLAQALIKHQVARSHANIDNNSQQLRIEIVSDHLHAVSSDDEICPEKVPVIALCKTIPQEYPNIICRSIDIRVPAEGSLEETRLIDRLTVEFTTPTQDLTIAYRRNTRWVKSYEPFRLKTAAGDPLLLRHNGVYLITGGLGNDSFIRAKYLAENFRARLVLTGRTPLPEKEYWSQYLMLNGEKDPVSIKIKRIQELESLGAEVLALSADVSDELDMRLVMQEIDQRFGILNGVIHAAGITNVDSSRLIIDLDRTESEWHFQPKVY
ncbi:MAG: acyltransferase domain-containing protein, partial [Acidobacteria bacterium]|nr:acyltransferase domain-containing protein [Acidobacteriota bacterium]